MRGLNKTFKADPVVFLRRLILVTRPSQPCQTCHTVLDLGVGRWAQNNPYARPDPMVLTFDMIAGAYGGGIAAGATFDNTLDPPPGGGGAPAPAAAGLAFDDPLAKYATLQVMSVGHARAARPIGWATNEYTAYWLPWTHEWANELHLNDPTVKFFFTALFSGCTFCVATPAGAGGAANVWVTHIAWDPGPNAPPAWGGAVLGPAGAGNEDVRRLAAEAAFYTTRGPTGPVRSVTAPTPHTLPIPALAVGFAPTGIPSIPLTPGAAPLLHARFSYGLHGRAFIVGWRGKHDAWHFAVQTHPTGHNALGVPAPVAAGPGVAPQVVHELY